jgi:hypothetical protein
MSPPHRAILAANLLVGPPVALSGPLVILAPVTLICAFLGLPFPMPSQIISLLDILFALLGALGIAYAYGLIPAFLHSCVMLVAMRSGFSRAMLLLIAPVSGFLVTTLFSPASSTCFGGRSRRLRVLRSGLWVSCRPSFPQLSPFDGWVARSARNR